MRKIFLICFLAMSYLSYSQGQPTALPTLYNGKYYRYTQYLGVDSGLFLPYQRDTNFTPARPCVIFNPTDSIVYISTGNLVGKKWKGIGSSNGTGVYNAGYGLTLIGGTFKVDTTLISTVAYSQGLYNILNSTKLNKTDTSTMLTPYLRKADTLLMLSPYLRKADTITLSNRIDLRVKYSDTALMLLPYLRKNDTVTISNRIDLKRNISDTALNAASTLTRGKGQNLIDSINYPAVRLNDIDYTATTRNQFIEFYNLTGSKELILPNPSNFSGKFYVVSNNYTSVINLSFSGTYIPKAFDGSDFIKISPSTTAIFYSNGIDWITTSSTKDLIWFKTGGTITPTNIGDTLSSINIAIIGGYQSGFISINTGTAIDFTVGGQHKFIEFTSSSTNTGLILSSTALGQEYKIRNSKGTSITISPSYIDLTGSSTSTITANSAISIVYDGTNYKQF